MVILLKVHRKTPIKAYNTPTWAILEEICGSLTLRDVLLENLYCKLQQKIKKKKSMYLKNVRINSPIATCLGILYILHQIHFHEMDIY